jgi:ubiquitin-conjugating enzyme E2 G1
MDGTSGSALLLMKQLRELNRHPVGGISAGLIEESNPFAWNVILVGPSDTLYEGGFFKARLDFPKDYPIKPPKMVRLNNRQISTDCSVYL